jgi:hypothetical protein
MKGEEGFFSTMRTGGRVNHFDMVDLVEFGSTETTGQRQMTIEAGLDRVGIHGGAVLKFDAPAQWDQQGLRIGPGVAEGKLRHDVELLIEVEQLVAQSAEDDTAGVSGGQGWIEHIGVVAQGNAKIGRGERVGGSGGDQQQSGKPTQNCRDAH